MKRLALYNEASLKDFNITVEDADDKLKNDTAKSRKKISEIQHVAKLFLFLEDKFQIEKLSEEPDFIISSTNARIGLEHQILIDPASREKEGFFENLCKLAEKQLRKDKDVTKLLVTVYVHPFFKIEVGKKKQFVDEICHVVRTYLKSNQLIDNEIIQNIFAMKHSQFSLKSNMGGWWQKNVNAELLVEAIERKERKIENYIKNTKLPQWLLIVIGGVGASSYIYEGNFDFKVESRFDKVFLLEDINNRLYEIK
jgi:hypothetical protein